MADVRRFGVWLTLSLALLAGCVTVDPPAPNLAEQGVRLIIVGTNDTHGELVGVAVMSGYVQALRDVHGEETVVLLDAGDLFQGTLESNMVEGASVVSAFNELGYDAAAIGNHEFDFGPEGEPFIPESPTDDPRGALKARAREAQFPFLAANLIDKATGKPVDWPNVRPSTMIRRKGINIGVVGVTTIETLDTTIRANTFGLRIAPLAASIEREARALRASGAQLVIVVAHAGGDCTAFDDPTDLSTCNTGDEIFQVARDLPRGLVDQIVAGHEHLGIAHVVNGIAVTNSYSSARAFGRVDYLVAADGDVLQRDIYPPQRVCLAQVPGEDTCADANAPGAAAVRYEGRSTAPVPAVRRVADGALARAELARRRSLNVVLETPITRAGEPDSAIGHLMTDAIREATGADISIHNVVGGIRADLPAGPLTFGDVHRVFPFDNRVAVVEMTGRTLKTMLAHQVHNVQRRAGISGLRVKADCRNTGLALTLERPDGSLVGNDEVLTVAANDFLLFGGDAIFTPVTPEDGFDVDTSQPRVRDLWVDWFIARGGTLRAQDYLGEARSRWDIPSRVLSQCAPPR